MALTKASHRRRTDLFTSCGLLMANLLPRHFYHLSIVSESETDIGLIETAHRFTYWNIRTYSSEQSRSHSHLVRAQLTYDQSSILIGYGLNPPYLLLMCYVNFNLPINVVLSAEWSKQKQIGINLAEITLLALDYNLWQFYAEARNKGGEN